MHSTSRDIVIGGRRAGALVNLAMSTRAYNEAVRWEVATRSFTFGYRLDLLASIV